MLKKAKVVILPSEKYSSYKSGIYINSRGQLKPHNVTNGGKQQHLHITTNDKIQEGDWCITNLGAIEKFNLPWADELIVSYKQGTRRIITTTDSNLNLPQPSQSFIEKYIEMYNKGQQITDVMIEFESAGTNEDQLGVPVDYDEVEEIFQLKINSKDNTITIRSMKTEWNKEEIIDKLHQYWASVHGEGHQNLHMIKWLEENLY